MRAVLYARRSAADGGESVDAALDRLRRHAETRGFEVVEEVVDALDRHDTPRPGWRRVLELVDSGSARAVVVEQLYRLFPTQGDLVVAWSRWAAAGVGVVSLDDALDTTQPVDALPVRRFLTLLNNYTIERHVEATRVGVMAHRLSAAGQRLRPARREVAVDDLEVRRLWESGESTRGIVRRIKAGGGAMSMGTLYKSLDRLRTAGRLDDAKRREALENRPPRKGGRPRKERGAP